MQKRLYRSVSDRKIAGVCAGVADYFNIDPTLVRVGWAIASVFLHIGIVAYIAGAVIIPEKPDDNIVDAL